MAVSSPEHSIQRFAELDAQIQAQAERRHGRPKQKHKLHRRSHAGIPAVVRKEITRLARELNRKHHQLFIVDHKLKDSAARLLRSLLPPKRKRGRPGMDSVTKAIQLRARFRSVSWREAGSDLEEAVRGGHSRLCRHERC